MIYKNLQKLPKILCRLCLDFNWEIEFVSGAVSGITWNSLKLVYSENADFSNPKSITASQIGANKTITFAPEGGFPANCYYKFVINVTSGRSNKYLELKEVKFYGYE